MARSTRALRLTAATFYARDGLILAGGLGGADRLDHPYPDRQRAARAAGPRLQKREAA
jgi:hypothetical protein